MPQPSGLASSAFVLVSAAVGSVLFSISMTWTGWPRIPPRELIQSFHTSTAGAQPPSEAACAPLHSQVSPITIGDFPLEAVVLVAAALAVLVVEPLELLELTQPVKPASRPATPAANTICLSHFRVTPRR